MVVREGCGDRNSAIQEGNLYDMNAKYADVVDLGSSCKQLELGWPSNA